MDTVSYAVQSILKLLLVGCETPMSMVTSWVTYASVYRTIEKIIATFRPLHQMDEFLCWNVTAFPQQEVPRLFYCRSVAGINLALNILISFPLVLLSCDKPYYVLSWNFPSTTTDNTDGSGWWVWSVAPGFIQSKRLETEPDLNSTVVLFFFFFF